MLCRIGPLVAILVVVFSVALPARSVAAQEADQAATGTVTIHLQTCNATGSANSVILSASDDVPRYLRNCVSGGDGLPGLLQIDGQGPDFFTETEAVWNAIPVGDHTAVAVSMGGEVAFTVGADGAELWAILAKHEPLPPGLGTVIANLVTCDVAGTADSVTLFLETAPATLTNCREGWTRSAGFLTLSGLAPDTFDGYVAVWYDLPYGDYIASAGTLGGDITVTLEDDTASFQASWDKHQTPGGSVLVSVYECDSAINGSAWIGLASDTPEGFADCQPGVIESREWGLRIDGERPVYWTSNRAEWILWNGPHVATLPNGAEYAFTIQADNYELAAYYGPNSTGTGVSSVTTLPKTGSGPDRDATLPAVAMLVASAVLGFAALRSVRTNRS